MAVVRRSALLNMKMVQKFDDREAAKAGGWTRPLTSANVEKQLADLGLESEFSTHNRIRGLSGGQKVKVVIAAAMWLKPQLIVLDEPTNYLDRDSLAALAEALRNFGGGVVVISHHQQFVSEVCKEIWHVNAGRLTIEGATNTAAGAGEKIEMKEETVNLDAFGNVSKVKSTKKLSRKEQKAKERRRANAIKNGEPVSSDDE
jgi:elongation factor 3